MVTSKAGDPPKFFLFSTTLWGAFFSFLGVLLPALGVGVSASEVSQIGDAFVNVLNAVLTFGGLIMVVVGRFKAQKAITVSPAKAMTPLLLFSVVCVAAWTTMLATAAQAQNVSRTVDIPEGTVLTISVNGQNLMTQHVEPGRASILIRYLSRGAPRSHVVYRRKGR